MGSAGAGSGEGDLGAAVQLGDHRLLTGSCSWTDRTLVQDSDWYPALAMSPCATRRSSGTSWPRGRVLEAELAWLSHRPGGQSPPMSFTTSEGRDALVADVDAALERLDFALGCLGEASELVDESTADRLDRELFRPVRSAYAHGRRALSGFAGRHQLEAAAPSQAGSSGTHSADPRVYLERAIEAASRAEMMIAELQDSLLPVEVGDQELRQDLAAVRATLDRVPTHGQALLSTLGR